jgi:peptidoglycan/LPS O-acetylase OafA/YrhL
VMGTGKRVYFRNLGALRFFAATAVIFHHVEQYKFWAMIPNAWGNTIVDAAGQKAVSFFFVLSGFLITYLLLEENHKTGKISVRDFYIRRVLRIWPVYYLVVLLILFVVPKVFDLSFLGIEMYDEKFTWKAIFLLTVLPNLLRVYSPSIVGGNQLWSIGVEEQFYLIWPLLIRSFVKNIVPFLLVFIAVKISVTVVLEICLQWKGSMILAAAHRFWILLKVEQMAVGALGAWILFEHKESFLRVIYNKSTWYLSVAAFIALMTLPLHHWAISYFEAIVFLLLIINISTNPSLRISMESRWLTRLGNISYGIYMYHTLCITVCIYALSATDLGQTSNVVFNIALYGSSIALTLGVAFLSYEYFEKYFLNLKERFMIVKSGKGSAA